MALVPSGSDSAVDREAESRRIEALRRELVDRLKRRTAADGGHETVIPPLKLYRYSHPTEPTHVLQESAVYVVVQGRKQVTVGDDTYFYDPSHYLAVSVDRDDHDGRALYVSRLRPALLDGFLRLVRLLDAPQDIPVLAPLLLRELHYHLLQSEQFGRLAQMAIGDGRLRRVSGAIAWINEHFAEPLRIEALAKQSHMSPSALHSHFKAVAAMSPIHYQKRLRLQVARRRLLSGETSAEAIGYSVGYASASQFSREYARLFGEPPRRDAERVRDAASGRVQRG